MRRTYSFKEIQAKIDQQLSGDSTDQDVYMGSECEELDNDLNETLREMTTRAQFIVGDNTITADLIALDMVEAVLAQGWAADTSLDTIINAMRELL